MDNNDRYQLNTSQQVLVSKGSSKRRSDTLSREALTVGSFIPEELVPDTQRLITFFEQYYQWMNQEFLSISAENENHQVKTTRTSKSLYLKRSPDEYIDHHQSEIQMLFDEVARGLPSNTAIDFRIVLKHILTLYNQKGGEESIQSFFRILYNIASSVYYPWDDVLIASAGQWDGERFISNKGFLSDKIHLQDSNYWQRFSYDIKVGVQEKEWREIYEALIHPSGFKFFASFIVIIVSISAKISKLNGQAFILDDLNLGAVFRIFIMGMMENKPVHLDTLMEIMYVFFGYLNSYQRTFTELAFYNTAPIYHFEEKTIDDLLINNNRYNIGTFITITE